MTLPLLIDPAPFHTDEHGVVRIGSTRVALERIVHAFDSGATAEEIVESYPSLTLADVYATITYILRHRAEVDAYMEQSEAAAEETRRMVEDRYPTADLRRRLRERRATRITD